MLVVARLGPLSSSGASRTVATLSRVAREDELVVVSGWTASHLAMRLGQSLPRHTVVLVAAQLATARRRPATITNLATIRRLVEDGAVVFCLAGGPGMDRTDLVAPVVARCLGADASIRVPATATGWPGSPVRPLEPAYGSSR